MKKLLKFVCTGIIGNLLLMLLISGGLIYGLSVYLNHYTRHDDAVVIPDFRGKSLTYVQKMLSTMNLEFAVVDTGYVAKYAPNTVLDQSLEPNMTVKHFRHIELTINAAHPIPIVLPDLANKTSRRAAVAKLTAMGFEHIKVDYVYGRKDWVYDVRVDGRSVLPKERASVAASITLEVGKGFFDDDYWDGVFENSMSDFDEVPPAELGEEQNKGKSQDEVLEDFFDALD